MLAPLLGVWGVDQPYTRKAINWVDMVRDFHIRLRERPGICAPIAHASSVAHNSRTRFSDVHARNPERPPGLGLAAQRGFEVCAERPGMRPPAGLQRVSTGGSDKIQMQI